MKGFAFNVVARSNMHAICHSQQWGVFTIGLEYVPVFFADELDKLPTFDNRSLAEDWARAQRFGASPA